MLGSGPKDTRQEGASTFYHQITIGNISPPSNKTKLSTEDLQEKKPLCHVNPTLSMNSTKVEGLSAINIFVFD